MNNSGVLSCLQLNSNPLGAGGGHAMIRAMKLNPMLKEVGPVTAPPTACPAVHV